MDNSMDILSLISELSKDPAALGAVTELIKGLGNTRPSQITETVQAANFPQFTASSQPKPPQNTADNNIGSGGFSPELLSSLLASLSGNPKQDEHHCDNDAPSRKSLNKLLGSNTDAENRTRLLNALRPYLSEERRAKIDLILRLLKVAELGKLSGILNSV